MKSQPAAVSFADGPPPPAYKPYQPVYSPPPAVAPASAVTPYAPFYPSAMLFADGGGPGRAMHPSYFPSLTGPAYGGAPGGSYPGAYAAPPAPDGAYATRPAAVAIKPEPGPNPHPGPDGSHITSGARLYPRGRRHLILFPRGKDSLFVAW